jgi:hypothetical protein
LGLAYKEIQLYTYLFLFVFGRISGRVSGWLKAGIEGRLFAVYPCEFYGG